MRRRVIALAVTVAVVAVALFLVPLCVAIARNQHSDDGRELIQMAALAASRVPDGYATGDPGRVPLPRLDAREAVAVYRPDASLVSGVGPAELDPGLAAVLHEEVVDRRIGSDRVVAVPIVADDGSVGAVRIAEAVSVGADRVHRLWASAIAAGLAAVAVTWLVAVVLARRLTRPVTRLVAEANRIGDGDFTASLEPTGMAEIDELGRVLAETSARIGLLVEREQALAADASHQLRTPLAGLRLTIESELEHPRPDASVALRGALRDVGRLEQTIEQLLSLARDSDGTRRGPVDLAPMLRALVQRWRRTVAGDGRPLRTVGLDHPVVARASVAAVEHVLEVLVDNARRHGRGTITLSARDRVDHVVLAVTDEGGGVADPARLFQRRAAGAAGSGIGLALARRLAEAEGGRLRYRDDAPTTAFELLLPTAVELGASSGSA